MTTAMTRARTAIVRVSMRVSEPVANRPANVLAQTPSAAVRRIGSRAALSREFSHERPDGSRERAVKPIRLLFVCMGNICRSPTAEGVMRALLREQGLEEEIEVDSAGTGDWHVGSPPDARARAAARSRGITLEGARAGRDAGRLRRLRPDPRRRPAQPARAARGRAARTRARGCICCASSTRHRRVRPTSTSRIPTTAATTASST